MKPAVTSGLVLMALLWRIGFVFAQNSAMFDTTTTTPPSAQAGKELVFGVRITNTGTETWMGDEYSVLAEIYDAKKYYLTETDEVRPFEDIGPGEVLTAEIPFDIPADYSGTYYYTIFIEFDDTSVLYGPYVSLRVTPTEKPRGVTGTLKIRYINNGSSSPSTNIDLNVLNQLALKRSLRSKVSGQNSDQVSEVKNFSLHYRSKSTGVSLGELPSALSFLTLRKLHGIKIETEMKGINFIILGDLATPQKVSTAKRLPAKNLYGLRGAVELADNFTVAGNYVQSEKNRGSVASVEADGAITPELAISGEYAHSNLEQDEAKNREDGAFRVTVSGTFTNLSCDLLYQKVGRSFYLLENSGLVQDREEHDLSLKYFIGRYIRGTVKHNVCQDQVSQRDTVSRRTTESIGLYSFFPRLPSFSITYGINKSLSAGMANPPGNNITNTLTIGLSKLIGKTRLSVTQIQADYQHRAEFLPRRSTVSTVYRISTPLNRQLTLSVNYRDSRIRGPTSSLAYAINENISEGTVGYDKTTTLTGSYHFTNKASLSITYTMQSNRNLASNTGGFSSSARVQFNHTYNIAKNHDLSLRYSLTSRRSTSTSNPQKQDIRLTYSYKF